MMKAGRLYRDDGEDKRLHRDDGEDRRLHRDDWGGQEAAQG